MSESIVTFKYKRNLMIQLGDEKYHNIPMRQYAEARNTQFGDQLITLPHFDLEKTHVVSLGELTPNVPRKRPEWSDSYFAKIEEAAFTAAIEQRAKAAHIIKRLKNYAGGKNPVIEIIADPEGLLTEGDFVSDAERTLAGLPTNTPAPTDTLSTSDMIAESRALKAVKA